MAFHDVRLPDDVERGATGGPTFKTTILQLSSGHEQRNIDWELARGKWDIGYGIQTKPDYQIVQDFFRTRQGRAHSFRFKDWSDYEMADQSIGTTDGSNATFPIYKRYSSGGIDYDRLLTKIVDTTVVATVNAVPVTVVYDVAPGPLEVSVALLTGILTLGATHAATVAEDVRVALEFDVPVRFDDDSFDLNLTWEQAGAVSQLPIVEVLDE